HFRIAHNFDTFLFFNSYQSPLSGHLAFWFSSNSSLCPYSLIHPVCLAGLPNTSAYGATVFVTTEPAPIKAYSPMSFPQTIVALAPIEAPFPTWVCAY